MCSAYIAKLWWVYEGFRYARRYGFILVELNVDSLVVTKTLLDGEDFSPDSLILFNRQGYYLKKYLL